MPGLGCGLFRLPRDLCRRTASVATRAPTAMVAWLRPVAAASRCWWTWGKSGGQGIAVLAVPAPNRSQELQGRQGGLGLSFRHPPEERATAGCAIWECVAPLWAEPPPTFAQHVAGGGTRARLDQQRRQDLPVRLVDLWAESFERYVSRGCDRLGCCGCCAKERENRQENGEKAGCPEEEGHTLDVTSAAARGPVFGDIGATLEARVRPTCAAT